MGCSLRVWPLLRYGIRFPFVGIQCKQARACRGTSTTPTTAAWHVQCFSSAHESSEGEPNSAGSYKLLNPVANNGSCHGRTPVGGRRGIQRKLLCGEGPSCLKHQPNPAALFWLAPICSHTLGKRRNSYSRNSEDALCKCRDRGAVYVAAVFNTDTPSAVCRSSESAGCRSAPSVGLDQVVI